MKAEDLRHRSFSLPSPRLLLLAAGAATLFGASVLGAAGYMLFHDELFRSLLDRQIEMQSDYEDRLAAARRQLDQAATRQTLDQDSVEGQIETLVLRETRLERRAAAVAALVERFSREGVREDLNAEGQPTPRAPAKPQPEDFDLRLGGDAGSEAPAQGAKRADHAALSPANAADSGQPAAARLATLALALDKVEREQARRLAAVARPAIAAARRLKDVYDMAGVSADRIVSRSRAPLPAAAVGGPFIALGEPGAGTTMFERDLALAQSAVTTLDRLRGALPSLPLRKPLNGELRLTSGFGYRTDPFLGKPALHSGVDLLDDYGEPVRAAAGGTVAAAGPSGGYGNMVEVDHGSGFSTRYGHLSQIEVAPGQRVAPGAVLGRVGSTGRSTGAHLHYEVRADGEAVDPARFLRAATTLAAMRE